MWNKAIKFIKYNNLTVLLVLAVFLVGGGVFAQTEAGQEFIGEKDVKIEGIDNILLLEVDLENLDMDFKIEKIEEDQEYYYVTYTYLDLVKKNNAWEYQLQEKVRKISKKLKKDLGLYVAEELKEQYENRIKELKTAKQKAEANGEEKRVEVVAYSGLIGQTLDLAGKILPNYEPVKKRDIPSPTIPPTILITKEDVDKNEEIQKASDNLTEVYNNYIIENDPDGDEIFGSIDNCPSDFNPEQFDMDGDGIGDVCDLINDNEQSKDPEINATSSDEQGVILEDEIANENKDSEDDSAERNNETDEPAAEEEVLIEEPVNSEPAENEVEIIELTTEE